MPIVKYTLIRLEGKAGYVPPDVEDGGVWPHPLDKTMVGWVDDFPKWDMSIFPEWPILSKQDFVDRALEIHSIVPYVDRVHGTEEREDETLSVTEWTTDEVVSRAEAWYDQFVSDHSDTIPDSLDDYSLGVLKKKKIRQAFKCLSDKLDNMTVDHDVSAANGTVSFGCDSTTIENITTKNSVAANSVNWVPKGMTNPVQLSKIELKNISEKLLNKREAAYGQYFTHKKAIMEMSNTDIKALSNYDFGNGYANIG